MNRPVRSDNRSSAARRGSRKGAAQRSGGRGGSARAGAGAARRVPAQGGEFAPPATRTPGLPPVAAFDELGLPAGLLRALTEQGVSEPFPIQAATLPDALAGRDVLGRGRTGSGKTLAFGLALLARLAGRRAEPGRPLGLVLVPTRELAQQVTDALAPYAAALRLRAATVVGGVSVNRQAAALRRGAELVVATPGRLKDLVTRGDCALDEVAVTVLDEADQMTDMGFLPQVTALLDLVGREAQTLLFSATLDRNVDKLVRRYLDDPVVHSVDPSAATVTTMEHHVLHVRDTEKRTAATEIAARDGRVLLFLGTKRAVDRFTTHLLRNGIRAAALHGGRSQAQRDRTLAWFKSGHITALVATNVAARGIHIDDLDLVVNVDPPADPKDYLHRGGRTARAGSQGSVVTLVLPDERRSVGRMMSDAGVSPRTTPVRAGEEELSRITGARTPSGVPVTVTGPETASAPASAPSGRRRRGRRSGGRGPAAASAAPSRGGSAGKPRRRAA